MLMSKLLLRKTGVFKTSWCNLKIRGLETKMCVDFLLFSIWKKLWRFKVKESMHFVEQKYNLL